MGGKRSTSLEVQFARAELRANRPAKMATEIEWVLVPRETLKAIRLYVDDCLTNRYIDAAAKGNLYAARDEVDRALAAPVPPEAQAVAYVSDEALRLTAEHGFYVAELNSKPHHGRATPLFASPSPAGGVQGVTVDELAKIIEPMLWERHPRKVAAAVLRALSSQAQTTGGE